MHPESFIAKVRDLHPLMVEICTKGGCYRMYTLLKSLYPQAECYYDHSHVITKIDGIFYDITGRVKPTKDHRPIDPLVEAKAHRWYHANIRKEKNAFDER